jgi:hypothetical protein
MKTRLAVAFASIALLLAIFVLMRTSSLSGSWTIYAETAEGVFPNGEPWKVVPVSGVLTLEQNGASVTGSWKGRQPEPWPLTGHIEGTQFEFQTEPRDIPAVREGQNITVARRWIFRGTAGRDTLSGSMSLAGNDGNQTTQPFSAERKQP